MLRGELVRVPIEGREDYIPVHIVEGLYRKALERGDNERADVLLEALTSPDPERRRVR